MKHSYVRRRGSDFGNVERNGIDTSNFLPITMKVMNENHWREKDEG